MKINRIESGKIGKVGPIDNQELLNANVLKRIDKLDEFKNYVKLRDNRHVEYVRKYSKVYIDVPHVTDLVNILNYGQVQGVKFDIPISDAQPWTPTTFIGAYVPFVDEVVAYNGDIYILKSSLSQNELSTSPAILSSKWEKIASYEFKLPQIAQNKTFSIEAVLTFSAFYNVNSYPLWELKPGGWPIDSIVFHQQKFFRALQDTSEQPQIYPLGSNFISQWELVDVPKFTEDPKIIGIGVALEKLNGPLQYINFTKCPVSSDMYHPNDDDAVSIHAKNIRAELKQYIDLDSTYSNAKIKIFGFLLNEPNVSVNFGVVPHTLDVRYHEV